MRLLLPRFVKAFDHIESLHVKTGSNTINDIINCCKYYKEIISYISIYHTHQHESPCQIMNGLLRY